MYVFFMLVNAHVAYKWTDKMYYYYYYTFVTKNNNEDRNVLLL